MSGYLNFDEQTDLSQVNLDPSLIWGAPGANMLLWSARFEVFMTYWAAADPRACPSAWGALKGTRLTCYM